MTTYSINIPFLGSIEKFYSLGNFGSCSAGSCGNADSAGFFQKNERDQVRPQCLYYPEYDFYSSYGDNFLTIV